MNNNVFQHFQGYELLIKTLDEGVRRYKRNGIPSVYGFVGLDVCNIVTRYLGNEVEYMLYGGYDKAFSFDEAAPDELGVAAICDGQIAGMAGASSDSPTMWQIGINVSLERRRAGIGTMLVTLLKNEILKRGYLPYYGTAFSHLASQRVALASGFLPAWAELVTSSLQESIDTGKASNSPG